MDVFNRNPGGMRITERLNILMFICLALLTVSSATASAQGKLKVAVLPFVIEAPEMSGNLSTDLQEMFASYIAGKGYQGIASDSVNQHPSAFKTPLEDSNIVALGQDLGADWVVSGVFSQSEDKSYRLNIKVTGIGPDRTSFPISAAVNNIDLLSLIVNNLSESIVNQFSQIPISIIQVKGNKRIESDAILATIDTKKGDKFDQARLDQDLRNIYKMGYFKDVSIETEDDDKGKTVTINVVELPFITQIKFEGNKEYKEEKLTGEIGIKKFAVLNLSEIKQSINKLKEFYKKNGYYNATITDKTDDLPNNEAVLTYVINEGEKVYITKIDFVGNEVFDDDDLIDLMKTNTKGFFYWLTSSGVFERNKLDYDIQTITYFYLNQGYIEARIGEPEITYDEKTGLTITISVIEGNRYKVGNVKFTGDVIKPEKELLSKININKQEYFSNEVLVNDTKILKNIYADEGYANTEIIRHYPENTDTYKQTLTIDLTFDINKKKKVRIEKINIKGNTRTRDKVIRRELKLVEGDYFSGTKLDRSTENIKRLDYLSDQEIKTKDGSSDDLMDIDVNVTEAKRGQFQIGAGYSSFDRLFAMVSFSMDNLFGKGQSASIDASVGSRTTQYNLKFVEPWLFDKPVSGSINVYDWKTDYTDFTKSSTGGALGVGFLLGIDDYARASASYSYDNAKVTSIYTSSSLVLQDMLGKNVKSSITIGVGRDSRDVYFMTSKGSINSISMEYAGGALGGSSAFNKYNAVSAWYIPVWWNNVLLVRGSAGFVDKRSGGKLPIYEKFMLGGLDSVRGYDSLSISPTDPATGETIGGQKMWLGSIEYRVPIMKKEGVMGLLFFDAGNAFKKDESWRLRAKRSTGFGIRWRSPMGDLRLEYGWKLDKEPGEDSGGFEFNMGGTF
jgi:outer membrane protein insertion porin family